MCIVLFGHVAILAYTGVVLVAGLGVLNPTQIIQIFLVGSPILAVAAYSGLTYILSPDPPDSQHQKAAIVMVIVTIGTPSLLIIALLVIYSTAFFWYHNLAYISIILGLIETSLGAYVGVIRDRLFLTKEDS